MVIKKRSSSWKNIVGKCYSEVSRSIFRNLQVLSIKHALLNLLVIFKRCMWKVKKLKKRKLQGNVLCWPCVCFCFNQFKVIFELFVEFLNVLSKWYIFLFLRISNFKYSLFSTCLPNMNMFIDLFSLQSKE